MPFDIVRFDDPITDPALHAAHNAFDNELIYEEDPTFGTRRLEDTAARLAHRLDDQVVTRWFAMDGSAIVGAAELFLDTEDVANAHLGWFDLRVLPGHRRRGLGSELLYRVARQADAAGRRLVMCESWSLVPAGAGFLSAKGFEAALGDRWSQLEMADLDLSLMDRWIERGRAQKDRFELFWLDGRWPADMLDDVVALSHVMNDAPVDALEFNDQAITRTHILSEENEIFERDFSRFVAAVVDLASGRMVGYTQMYINPSFPHLGQQGDTGVLEEFRGNRLGKWLKAEVARYLVDHHPEITKLRTSNADSNAPMLAINEEMGFTPHHQGTVWQKPVAEVLSLSAQADDSTTSGSSASRGRVE